MSGIRWIVLIWNLQQPNALMLQFITRRNPEFSGVNQNIIADSLLVFSLQYNSPLALILSLKNDCVKTALYCCPPGGNPWEMLESVASFTTHRTRDKRRPVLCVTWVQWKKLWVSRRDVAPFWPLTKKNPKIKNKIIIQPPGGPYSNYTMLV
jgi:hypothetical protein